MEMTIRYGNGTMRIDVARVLEKCTKHDFSNVLACILQDSNCDEHVAALSEFISGTISELKEKREAAHCAEDKSRYTSRIKRYVGFNDMLVKKFGVEPISDSDIVRTSSCDVYATMSGNGNLKINRYSGVRFEKHGLVFHAYKKGSCWTVIVPSVGLGIGIAEKSKAVAIQRVTEDLAGLIRERVFDNSEMRESFVKLMRECEFEFALEGADFAALVTESIPIAEAVVESRPSSRMESIPYMARA